MNKIILISCVLSIALSLSAPTNGFIGCQNDATNYCAGGTCNAATGVCTCATGKFGFSCAQSSALVTPTADLSTCPTTPIAVGGTGFAANCNTALTATLVPANWSSLSNNFTQFSNFLVTFASGTRTAVFAFTTAQMQNALDYAEYQWIYTVYNVANTSVTTFDMAANKTTAVNYLKAIQAMVSAFMIGNTKQTSGTQNSVTDNATAAKFQAFTTTVGTWVSQIYAIDTTSGDNLGVKLVTTGILVNTIDVAYGSAWSSTNALVGYQQLFKSWGNPAVSLKKGCLYSALLIVQKFVIASTTSAATTPATLVANDFAASKFQALVFSDSKIDTKYQVATIPIALTGDGEIKATACVDGKCSISLQVSSGSQLVYVYTDSLSNYLISFSLILSALTLSL